MIVGQIVVVKAVRCARHRDFKQAAGLGQQVQVPIDGGQADVGIDGSNPLINFFSSRVVAQLDHAVQHQLPLDRIPGFQ